MSGLLPPRLLAITDLSRYSAAETVARARALSLQTRAGGLAVLLRDHETSVRERLRLGRELRELTREAGQELWVADRLDLVLALQADGAHLGEASVAALEARQLLGDTIRISRAWHGEAAVAELAGVDALLVSPIFEPRKGRPALGVEALGATVQLLQTSGKSADVYALGGVSAAHVNDCVAAGAHGIAAIGAAWSDNVTDLVTALGIRR